jgi:hypothetical protein
LFYRRERLQGEYGKLGRNPTQKQLESFKQKKLGQKSLPRGIVGRLLEKIGQEVDTSNMNTPGLTSHLSRIKGFNKMQAWRDAVEEFMEDVPENAANISLSDSDSQMGSHEQNAEDKDDSCRIVTTSLRQIVRNELDLVDIEQQLTLEQKTNHQVFEALYRIIQEVTDMVRLSGNGAKWLHCYCTDFHQLLGHNRQNLLNCW